MSTFATALPANTFRKELQHRTRWDRRTARRYRNEGAELQIVQGICRKVMNDQVKMYSKKMKCIVFDLGDVSTVRELQE